MKKLNTDLTGYAVMRHEESIRTQNPQGEVMAVVEKRVITASKVIQLSTGRKIEAVLSVTLEGNEFGVQVNVPSLRNMSMDEWQEHSQILQSIQTKGNELKAELEAEKSAQ